MFSGSDDDDRDSGLQLTGEFGGTEDGQFQSLMGSPATYNLATIRSSGMQDDAGASTELASVFALITNFEPNMVELTVHWKPFIPPLTPAIGAIDAFIKVPRPDGELDDLGLVILDEPSIAQSNPQVLRMELREEYGISSPANEGDGYAGFIENAPKNQKALTSWLDAIEEIHRNRPPGNFIYSSTMPEIQDLMEVWPKAFEDALDAVGLPSAELDVSFEDLVRLMCAILEIPVRNNIVESLHCLFTLFAEFERNPAFQQAELPQFGGLGRRPSS